MSFPNLLAYWVQHFHSIFRIWNSSAGIPSPPVALFVVNLPKAHLTSCCRISGSSWVITPSWLSGSLRPFLYSSFVYCCHLLLISYTYVRSFLFLSYTVPIFAWNVLLTSPVFLKRSLVFPILLFSSISLHCSFKKAFLTLLAVSGTLHSVEYVFPFLLCLSLLFFPRLFVKPPQTGTLPSCILSFGGLHFVIFFCTVLRTSVHRSSGTLSTRSSPLNLFTTSSVQPYGIWFRHTWILSW